MKEEKNNEQIGGVDDGSGKKTNKCFEKFY